MPRPEDAAKPAARKAAIAAVAAGIAVAAAVALAVALAPQEDEQAPAGAAQPAAASAADAADGVEGIGELEFLDGEGRAAFAEALRARMAADGVEWPSGAEVTGVSEVTDTTARVDVSFDGGSYVCRWVSGTATPFTFAAGGGEEEKSYDRASDLPSTSSGGSSGGSGPSVSSGRSASGGSSGSPAPSGSSGPGAKAHSAPAQPVRASERAALERALPQKAAWYLPTVIENYLASKGISADGGSAVIDLASVSRSGVGYEFEGYVVDSSGTKRWLEFEWNATSQRYGMSVG